MLQNNTQKYVMWLGLSVLVIDHPYLMIISFLIYSLVTSLSIEEVEYIKNTCVNLIKWVKQFKNTKLGMTSKDLIDNLLIKVFINLYSKNYRKVNTSKL
jgi:hypothetical protein